MMLLEEGFTTKQKRMTDEECTEGGSKTNDRNAQQDARNEGVLSRLMEIVLSTVWLRQRTPEKDQCSDDGSACSV